MPDPLPITIASYALRWLARQSGRVAAATLVQYANAVHRWIIPTLGYVPIAEVTRALLRDTVAAWTQTLTVATVRTRLVPLRGLFDDAVEDGLLPANPTHDLARRVLGRQREANPAEKAFREPETWRFFQAAPGVHPELADFWLTLHRAGLRPGEGLALEWRNVFETEAKARIAHTYSQGEYGPTKSRRMRWVDLSDDLVAALGARRERLPGRWVFPSAKNRARPWSYSHMLETFRAICEAAGLPAGVYTPHAFRHTFATWLSEEPGVPTRYLQASMGHASLAVTDRYVRGARTPNLGFVNAIDRRARRPLLGIAPAHGPAQVRA